MLLGAKDREREGNESCWSLRRVCLVGKRGWCLDVVDLEWKSEEGGERRHDSAMAVIDM